LRVRASHRTSGSGQYRFGDSGATEESRLLLRCGRRRRAPNKRSDLSLPRKEWYGDRRGRTYRRRAPRQTRRPSRRNLIMGRTTRVARTAPGLSHINRVRLASFGVKEVRLKTQDGKKQSISNTSKGASPGSGGVFNFAPGRKGDNTPIDPVQIV